MKIKMSLHRIISEIKAVEAKLQAIPHTQYVSTLVGNDADKVLLLKASSQSAYDKAVSQMTNLAALKAARNKANSTTLVTIGGKQMTIDEALGIKASVPFRQNLINTVQHQFVAAQTQVDRVQAVIDQKVATQLSTMFSGTKKATQEEIDVVRNSAERDQKAIVVHAAGLKECVEALKNELEAFVTEVDYVLSEANATTTTEVEIN